MCEVIFPGHHCFLRENFLAPFEIINMLTRFVDYAIMGKPIKSLKLHYARKQLLIIIMIIR